MKYYLVKKVDKEYKILDIMHNRKELLYIIKQYHNRMYYCNNGAYNYSNKVLIEIFNNIENYCVKKNSQVHITKENKYINTYYNIYDILEV